MDSGGAAVQEMRHEALACLRNAGRIAADARRLAARLVVPGAPMREVCEQIEAEIVRRGGEVAFPVQSSCNEVAAHYCPSPDDPSTYARGDLAKLDIGVHVDGWVVDTAITVNVGTCPENRVFLDAVEGALAAAIERVRAGILIHEVSSAIERALRAHGMRPMRQLCGHGLGRFIVHSPPPIPNSAEPGEASLPMHAVVAIEPFATAGAGLVAQRGRAEVFRVDPAHVEAAGLDRGMLSTLKAFRGLPFARRHLKAFPRRVVETTLAVLVERGQLMSYPPLVESGGGKVAQAEHTVYLGPRGVEVLTL